MTRTIERMVEQEVLVYLSSLVSTLAGACGDHDTSAAGTDLGELAGQAFELASPVLDYEEAAREAGWAVTRVEDGASPRDLDVEFFAWSGGTSDNPEDETAFYETEASAWEAACRDFDIEPHEREVFEHWAVTEWFAEKLEAAGEKVDRDFAGMCVWARTTAGQAIYADAVIERIYAEASAA